VNGTGGISINGCRYYANFTDTLVYGNVGQKFGGGFFIQGESQVSILRTNVMNNGAISGAGYFIYTELPQVIIQDSSISYNNVTANFEGGAFYFESLSDITAGDNTQIVQNCTISNNQVFGNGGAFYIKNPYVSGPILLGLNIQNNVAGAYGGGVYLTLSINVTFMNCTLQNNYANIKGSGIYCNSSTTSDFINSGNINIDSVNCATDCAGLCSRDNSSSQSSNPGNNPGINTIIIICIVAGVVVLVGLVAFFYYRHYRKGYSPIK